MTFADTSHPLPAGNRRLDVLPVHLAIVLALLQKHVPSREVWAFGSRLNGNARRYSDRDLVIMGSTSLDYTVYASLVDDFRESSLPWKVDVLEWALTTPTFQTLIRANRIPIQSPSPRDD